MTAARSYDHRAHAGNAGDVWKHFILAEAADHLLSSGQSLVYAESHVGRPQYLLDSSGEWMGGIGRCWERLTSLINFCYFRVLSDLNPQGLRSYPGSAFIVRKIAGLHNSEMHAQVWDTGPEVARAWAAWEGQENTSSGFHLGDGFAGVRFMLDSSPSGLLLIDPPYVDAGDAARAEDLLCLAAEKRWTVLWWSMMGMDTFPQFRGLERLSLRFADMGMYGGRWEGATVAVHSADLSLIRRLKGNAAALAKTMKIYR